MSSLVISTSHGTQFDCFELTGMLLYPGSSGCDLLALLLATRNLETDISHDNREVASCPHRVKSN